MKRFRLLINEDNVLEYIQDLVDYEDIPVEKLEDLLNEQDKRIMELEKECVDKLDMLDRVEIGTINLIYEEKGFNGIIEYSKQKLSTCGTVQQKNGLVMMATGGWSDNEDYLYCLNHVLSNFGRNHYVGYLLGGAFYYSKDKYDSKFEIMKIMRD